MECPVCGSSIDKQVGYGESVTAVGYFPEMINGVKHNHDDNCRIRQYVCETGHKLAFSKRNKCSIPGCSWVGKRSCFCHEGEKIDEWPTVPFDRTELRKLYV